MTIIILDYEDPFVAQEANREFQQRGFIFIKNHPLSVDLLSRAYGEWSEFFDQSLGMKGIYHFNVEKAGPKDGYFPLYAEHAKGIVDPDIKEFYHFYPWGQTPHDLMSIAKKIHDGLLKMGLCVLNWISKGDYLSAHEDSNLSDIVDHGESTVTRILHYPPLDFENISPRLRSAAHEDVNLLTVYPAATQEGLEFKDNEGIWHRVPSDPSIVAIGIGDMLALWSRGRLQATTHRVINPSPDHNYSRYAFLLFLHAKNYVQLSPEHTAASYLAQRFRDNGVLTQRTPKIHQKF